MKKLFITCFAAASIIISSCGGSDKPNRDSDTSAAKGSGGPADSSKAIASPNPTGTSPGSTDTSNVGKNPAEPMGDTVKKP